MRYQLRPGIPMVCVKNRKDEVVYHYARPAHGMFGPIIPWISDDQAAHLLRCNMVELIDDEETDSDADQPSEHDRVNAIIAALDELEVPVDAGSPTARGSLRAAGHTAPNDLVAAAVKLRKRSHGVVA